MSLINKIVDKYENLSVRKKAVVDVVSMFSVAILAALAVNFIAMYGYWMEMAFILIAVGMVGLVKTMYSMRLAQHQFEEKFKGSSK